MAWLIELLNIEACKTRYLLDYFGEDLGEPCGHCSYCEEGKTDQICSVVRNLSSSEEVHVDKFLEERPIGTKTPREYARFLCGIASPKLRRSPLTKNRLFCALEKAPFHAVLKALEKRV